MNKAIQTILVAGALCALGRAQYLEDFEHNNPTLWNVYSGAALVLGTTSAHDGLYGANPNNSGWTYRTDTITSPGDTIRWFVRFSGSSGRTYCGVAASSSGCYSAVLATNTGNILLQQNSGYGYADLGNAPVTWTPNTWYQLELLWDVSGAMTVSLYDEPGTTLIATTGPVPTGQTTPGGLALRGFGHNGDVDSIGGGSVVSIYCTAKTNSLGCVPTIAGNGASSATATSGFSLDCTNVRNQKPGLLFYAVGGSQVAVTFQCGTLCVGPSGIRRAPVVSSGGNLPPANDCTGMYSIDVNAFGAGAAGGNPDPGLLTPGNSVHAQWWGIDQGFAPPCNTALSDAAEFTIGK